jgi:hypothetical protein
MTFIGACAHDVPNRCAAQVATLSSRSRVESVAKGTNVHALIRGDASGLYRLAAPLRDRLTQR